MLGEQALKQIADAALAASRADQTEVLVSANDSALTRFANNVIHQNVAETGISVTVRVVKDKRIGVASANDPSVEGVRALVETAGRVAAMQPPISDFISLPGPLPSPPLNVVDEPTAGYTPEERAAGAGIVCHMADDNNLVASGTFSTSLAELAVANSLGVWAYHAGTEAEFTSVVRSETGTGYAAGCAASVGALEVETLATEAITKALRSQNPIELKPGEYEVILEEYAVSDIVGCLAYLGFSALAVQEQRSFMGGKLGQRLLSPLISIWDDGRDSRGLPMPFDFEGVPKQKLTLIEHGVARAVCYDSYTAGREGKPSTGHALPPGDNYGPFPLNLFLAQGDASKDEMLKGTKRGIWVTRFWYTRPVHPLEAIVTGMTRDGTFLIEDGEIVAPIKNLRFTQSYLKALNSVQLVGRDARTLREFFPVTRVPALKLGAWTFTGATEFYLRVLSFELRGDNSKLKTLLSNGLPSPTDVSRR